MSAATASPTAPPRPPAARVTRPVWLYDQYEDDADDDVCLHLPVGECDHRVYRCLLCCEHATAD